MIVPVAAFTSVPVVTVSWLEYPLAPGDVNSIAPLFVNPFVNVAFALAYVSLARTSITDVSPVVTVPFTVDEPSSTTTPPFATAAMDNELPAVVKVPPFESVPAPAMLPVPTETDPLDSTANPPDSERARVPTANVCTPAPPPRPPHTDP